MAEASLMGSRDAKNWPAEGCRPGRCTPAGRPLVSRDVRSGDEGKEELVTPGAKPHSRAELFLPSPSIQFSWSKVTTDPCLRAKTPLSRQWPRGDAQNVPACSPHVHVYTYSKEGLYLKTAERKSLPGACLEFHRPTPSP